MSISRTAYLSLAALLAIAPAACGGDDDGDGGGAADSGGGGQADAGGGEADAAGEPDAGGGEADAATVEGVQYLLGVFIDADTILGPRQGILRLIATVDADLKAGSADFSLQPVISPVCDKTMTGQPVGDPRVETGVTINKDGTFELDLSKATLPQGSVGIAEACSLGDLTGDLTVTGTIFETGPCGTISGAAPPAVTAITGTFGAVLIEPGTIGEDLPKEVIECE